jgi:hypothetical protein
MKMAKKPKVIHIGNNDNPELYKCGEERINWAEKYMDDSFAKNLPLCEMCKKLSKID